MAGNSTAPAGYAPFDLYPYNPSQPVAYAFLAMFGILGVMHLIAIIPYRSFFPIPLIIGCGMEAVAYFFRSQSHDDLRKTLPFLLQNLLLLASPPFLAASIYMSPRRIARVLENEDLVVSPRVLTKLFVIVDITCFVTQVAGAIMSGSDDLQQASQGKTIILIGLILQIIAFVFFAAWTATFHVRMSRSTSSPVLTEDLSWQRCLYGLYAISLFFIIRNMTRVIEYNQGSKGEMLSSEVYLYALDGGFMLLIIATFLALHPGRLRFNARRIKRNGYLKDRIPLV